MVAVCFFAAVSTVEAQFCNNMNLLCTTASTTPAESAACSQRLRACQFGKVWVDMCPAEPAPVLKARISKVLSAAHVKQTGNFCNDQYTMCDIGTVTIPESAQCLYRL